MIRILRANKETDPSILQVCRKWDISEQTVHRRKREFGMKKLDQANRLMPTLADEILGKNLLKEERCSKRMICRQIGLHRSTFHSEAGEPAVWLACLNAAVRLVSRENPEMPFQSSH